MADSTLHARCSPSGAHRWLTCTASVVEEAAYPDESSVYADEGTLAHEVAAAVLRDSEIFPGHEDEMAEYVRVYTDYCWKEAEGNSAMIIEQRVQTGIEGIHGTADCIVLHPDDENATIIDLKYGRGVPVSAKNNPQLKLYALGVYHEYSLISPIRKVKMVIVQPRLGSISEETITIDELLAFRDEVNAVFASIEAGVVTYVPSEDACRFCKAKSGCMALHNAMAEVYDEGHIPVDPQVLGFAMSQVGLMEDFCKGIRAAVESELLAGRSIPGWKLVAGRAGARKWTDEAEAEAYLKKTLRLKNELIYDYKLISPTSAEKLFKAGAISLLQWERLNESVARAGGSPSVAPESDKRPALQVGPDASDYDDLPLLT